MKEITIKKFTTAYASHVSENTNEENEKIFKALKVKDYLPFADKLALVRNVVNVADRAENGRLHFNTAMEYTLFTLFAVFSYTNLSPTDDKSTEDYDLLVKTNALGYIMENIPKDEIKALNDMLGWEKSDAINNEYEPHAFIANKIETISQSLGISVTGFLNTLKDQFGNLGDDEKEKLMQMIGQAMGGAEENANG